MKKDEFENMIKKVQESFKIHQEAHDVADLRTCIREVLEEHLKPLMFLQEKVSTQTLSELIATISKKYGDFTLTKVIQDTGWIAIAREIPDYGEEQKPEFRGLGNTPEEAVAKLWLVLKKYKSFLNEEQMCFVNEDELSEEGLKKLKEIKNEKSV